MSNLSDLLVLAAFLAGVLGLGAAAAKRRRRGLEDYALAGRTLTFPLFVASLVPTFYGGALGIGEFTWANGLSNWLVMAFPYYVFAAAYAFLLAGKVRLAPGLTIPDHLESAYGRPLALLGAWLIFLLACPADEFLMIGTLLSHLSGLSLPAAMLLAAGVAIPILWRGGLRSDVAANCLQFAAMFVGFAVILPFAFRETAPAPSLSSLLPPSHLSLTGGLSPLQILAWWAIASWTVVDPSFHQRCAAARDPATARRGILASIIFWALFDLMTTAAGLYARAILPELERPLLAFPLLADRLLPPVLRGLFYAGLAASTFAALQGTTLLAALSLGKDGVGRWKNAGDSAREQWSRRALLVAAALALFLAWRLPSVVGLWYAVGSAVIPGLLLPLLGVYFPSLRPAPRAAFASALAGWLVSSAWLLTGQALGRAPLGLEPLFPGLLAGALPWLLGRQNKYRS